MLKLEGGCYCKAVTFSALSHTPYPYALAVYTLLPVPPESVHIMLDFKESWIVVPTGEHHRHFERYPDEGIVDWHNRYGLHIE